jgi:formiminoglutamase
VTGELAESILADGTQMTAADDPLWPRASGWLRGDPGGDAPVDLALLGVPASSRSLSPTQAHRTPAAVRAALHRYSTWCASSGTDLAALRAVDLGDVAAPDEVGGEQRIRTAAASAAQRARVVVAVGGDNWLTYPVARGLGATGLVTLDAHHDLRDGHSNGSPVRLLVEAGLDGRRVVQVGIADFANSAAYAERARDLGITVVPRSELRRRWIAEVVGEAISVAAGGDTEARVHVDLDVDVCDRSVAPACPASLPGGLSADELRAAAFAAGADPRVVGVDIVEVDAQADAPDQRTVRLAAVCVLEVAAGLMRR